MKYKIGDKVQIKRTDGIGAIKKGDIGIIKNIDEGMFYNILYGIEFDKYNPLRHDLQGAVKNGHGYLVSQFGSQSFMVAAK